MSLADFFWGAWYVIGALGIGFAAHELWHGFRRLIITRRRARRLRALRDTAPVRLR